MHVFMYVCLCIYIYVCVCIHVYLCVYTHISVCVCVHMFVYLCVLCMYVCACACACMCLCITHSINKNELTDCLAALAIASMAVYSWLCPETKIQSFNTKR